MEVLTDTDGRVCLYVKVSVKVDVRVSVDVDCTVQCMYSTVQCTVQFYYPASLATVNTDTAGSLLMKSRQELCRE